MCNVYREYVRVDVCSMCGIKCVVMSAEIVNVKNYVRDAGGMGNDCMCWRDLWRSQRDSNPRRSLERAVS